MVLAELFKAAEKDVKRLQADINGVKARGLARADIAVMEEKLHKMQLVMQQGSSSPFIPVLLLRIIGTFLL